MKPIDPAAKIEIVITVAEASMFTSALADIICWANGFGAARAGTDLSSHDGPLGIGGARELKHRLDTSLRAATGVTAQEIPF